MIYITLNIFLVPSTHGRLSLSLRDRAGVLHLNEVFNVCCFARFEEDSSNHLMCETSERRLSRPDFRWWSTTTSQVEQKRRLLSAWNFPGYCLAHSCGVMLHGFFFGFTLNTNLSIFKAKTREGSCFTAKLIKDGCFLQGPSLLRRLAPVLKCRRSVFSTLHC